MLAEIHAQGAELVGITIDSLLGPQGLPRSSAPEITLLADFHPKGEVCRAYGAYLEERGHRNRSLVLIDEDGVVLWVYESPSPLEIPGANLIFDALAAADEALSSPAPGCPRSAPTTTCEATGRRRSSISTSPARTAPRPGRGSRRLPLRLVFRHFPVASKHPRAPALHAAVEAAALQGSEEAFWALVDSIYRDQAQGGRPPSVGRVREALGLDVERFDRDRRSDAVAERVRRDFEGGIRAGVTGAPAVFVAGQAAEVDDLGSLAL